MKNPLDRHVRRIVDEERKRRAAMSDDQHEEFGLVMPFVVVASKGGPLDDTAYVAGFEVGVLDQRLANGCLVKLAATVHTVNVPQLELLAMRRGYRMTVEATNFDEWSGVEFERDTDEFDTALGRIL